LISALAHPDSDELAQWAEAAGYDPKTDELMKMAETALRS